MKLQEFYRTAVALGIEFDPRGPAWVKKALQRAREEYNMMTTEEKVWSGKEHTINPYDDTRVLNGSPDMEIKNKILVGIDIGSGEILVADKLRQRGKKIDLIVAHHPEGKAYAKYHTVIQMQAEILHKFGIPINVADGILSEKIREVENRVLHTNIDRASDIAALLDIPFICIHTPADNAATTFLQRLADKEKPERLGDIMTLLKTIPEYKEALKRHHGPKILSGEPSQRAGKIFVDMIGGYETSIKIYEKLALAGIGTIITTCMSEEHRKEASENHVAVIAAGSIASDSLGVNLILDRILDSSDVDIAECSGFRRFSHK